MFLIVLLTAQTLILSSCNKNEDDGDKNDYQVITITPGANAAEEAQTALINSISKTIIEFEEGTYSFTNTLSMDDKTEVIIRGAGRDLTILDFSGQISGAEGV